MSKSLALQFHMARRAPGALFVVELAAVAVAITLAVVPLSPLWIERFYSTAVYPHIQRLLTPLSNHLPFAMLDLLLVVIVSATIGFLARAIRDAWRMRSVGRLASTLWHLAAAGAALYLIFLGVWGLNYRRVRMTDRLVIERAAPSSEDVIQLGLMAVGQLNSLYSAAHAVQPRPPEWQDASLRRSFEQILHALSDAPDTEPGRLKHSLLGPYFRWTGVDGMVNPFGLEVIVNPDLLPFERPFIAAHEWAHLAGYGDESEANFIGWLTSMRASPAAQYSGWFYLYWQISGEVNAAERERLNMALAEGPRGDINAVIGRLRRGEVPALQAASWKIYDKYLKANRVESGVRSYGEVVNLILRARYRNGWIPVRPHQPPPSPSSSSSSR
jgi:hypothetical protein